VTSPPIARPGALVISLDFELHWGVRDKYPVDGAYRDALLGARRVIPRMLEMFEEFDVAATWATVGFLFARSRADLERFNPAVRPRYRNPLLSPYSEQVGESEDADPLHLARSLVERIGRTPRQEIGTHTYSHYYCGEEGQTAETFQADLAAAVAIAKDQGIRLQSVVFPRNQHNPAYDAALVAVGIRAYRGNPRSRLWRFANAEQSASNWKRAGRLADAYFGAAARGTFAWDDILQESGLSDVRASHPLRPYHPALRVIESVRLRRLCRGIRFAARTGRLFHLWWHPHNFGRHQTENLCFLREVLREFAACRTRYGMMSLSMGDVDALARGRGRASGSPTAPPTRVVPSGAES
jgi:peptidoglycan/xylan/chitin deacetylase (PgdA/CDA1 family)